MTKERPFNFNAGPAILPMPVLEQIREELLALPGVGLSILEISHRSADFDTIANKARQGISDLYGLNDDFEVLFLQGGASQQFEMVPLNLLHEGDKAQYIVTGVWGQKAFAAAQRSQHWTGGKAENIFTDIDAGYTRIPKNSEYEVDPVARYVHITSNETVHGIEWKKEPETGDVSLVADISSNMLSRPIDFSKYGMVYGGAQKNVGPAGVTIAIIRKDFLYPASDNLPITLDYHTQLEKHSLFNTPNTFGIYAIALVCDWLKEQGGLEGIAEKNNAKAKLLYDAIDSSSGFYVGHAQKDSRSLMNVTFNLTSPELEAQFITDATNAGFVGIKGHRSVGGLRASIYNAQPQKSVQALVDFMADFAKKHG